VNVDFDKALQLALAAAERATTAGWPTTIVRDLLGRCRLVLDDRQNATPITESLEAELKAMLAELGNYCPAQSPLLMASQLLDHGALIDDGSVARLASGSSVGLLERSVTGQDWRTASETADQIEKIVFYSLKGGVGRSTAAAFLARDLSERGHCVLLVDLDLESPGLGPMLLDQDTYPEYGIVDVLAEAAVGNDVAYDAVTRCLKLGGSGNGETWVAPAGGRPRDGYTYLPKLERAYAELPGQAGAPKQSFAARLQAAIENISNAVEIRSRRPSVVLIDSRAGMHDIAGVALTHLADLGLLFAGDTELTWWGYGALFDQWAERPTVARKVRERLQVVASMVDGADPDTYLSRFTDNAASTFEKLYDESGPGDSDSFSPSRDDPFAPHSPIPIYFDSDLRHLNAARLESALSSQKQRRQYLEFIDGVRRLMGEHQ
jgi:CobQ/CobB/MinD/ParA nucleotide binding domain